MPRTVNGLRLDDARALLRLCNALHEAPDHPASRKRLLLKGLCGLLRAQAGVCVVTRTGDGADPADRASIVSVVRWAVSAEDARALAACYRPHATAAAGPRGGAHSAHRDHVLLRSADRHRTADHCLEAPLPVPGTPLRACL